MFRTKSRFFEAFLKLKFKFFKCFLKPEPVGADLLSVEPEPKKKYGAGAEEKWFGSATLLRTEEYKNQSANNLFLSQHQLTHFSIVLS